MKLIFEDDDLVIFIKTKGVDISETTFNSISTIVKCLEKCPKIYKEWLKYYNKTADCHNKAIELKESLSKIGHSDNLLCEKLDEITYDWPDFSEIFGSSKISQYPIELDYFDYECKYHDANQEMSSTINTNNNEKYHHVKSQPKVPKSFTIDNDIGLVQTKPISKYDMYGEDDEE